MAESYRAELHPEGQDEEDQVERMAIATYRLRRITRIEVAASTFACCLKARKRCNPRVRKKLSKRSRKSKVTPVHPIRSGDSDTREQPASAGPTAAAAPPDAEK